MLLYELSAHELGELLASRQVSAVEATKTVIDRIEAVEDQVQAYVTRTAEQAFAQARAVDAARSRGQRLGPLAGIPMALKDNLCTAGIRTTCCSRMLADWVPPYEATVVRRLKDAGAVILGKLNMDEFAMGTTTETSAFFPTRNPWDLERIPGGSSGGAAAAVAAGEAFYTLGSDTGGSIRQPAAFCGVVGLKPTYGWVSRYGLVAFAASLDQVGPVTRDVTDCALILAAIAGHDPNDCTTVNLPVPDYRAALNTDIKGLKIGVPREYFPDSLDPEVATIIHRAIDKLAQLGAVCEDTSLPHTEYALPAYKLVAYAEASSNLARYDGVSFGLRVPGRDVVEMTTNTRTEGFGPEVKRRLMIGTYALDGGNYEAFYLKAAKVRTLIRQDFEAAFAKYDLLVTPTKPMVAFHLGDMGNNTRPAMAAIDSFTTAASMAGLPALSLPCGFSQGLPVGLQLIGPAFAEARLLRAAYAFEQNTEYHRRRPALGVA